MENNNVDRERLVQIVDDGRALVQSWTRTVQDYEDLLVEVNAKIAAARQGREEALSLFRSACAVLWAYDDEVMFAAECDEIDAEINAAFRKGE